MNIEIRDRVCKGLALAAVVAGLMASPAAAQDGLVVKVYGCPAGQADAVADQLRTEFGILPNVRIAADVRTSQVIVQAPAEVQARVSQRMAATAAPAPATPAEKPLAVSSETSRETTAAQGPRTVVLRNAKPEQIEASLWNMLGNRLSALPADRAQSRRYRLALAGGGAVDVTFDAGSGQVAVEGAGAAVDACARLIQVLDSPAQQNGRDVRLLALRTTQTAGIQRAADVIRNATGPQPANQPLAASLFQQRDETGATPQKDDAAQLLAQAAPPPAGEKPAEGKGRAGLVNPVQIEMLDGLDVLVLRGNAQDVQQVMDIINQIERLSAETEPAIEILPLKFVDCQSMATLVQTVYAEVFQPRQGSVSITPVVKPNAMLVVGRPENVKTVLDLIGRLDQPVVPNTQFHVFHLRYAPAATAQTTIQQFFADRVSTDRPGLGTVVRVIADARSNALIVQAAPRDMAEVAALIQRLDTATSAAVNEVRIIQLEHSLAQDVANILQQAIGAAATGRMPGQAGQPGQPGQPGAGGQPGQPGQPGQQGSAAQAQSTQRAAMLRFLTLDAKERKLLNSGIMSDVRITADVKANALIIAAPPENLELLEALVRQIDRLPAAEAQIKVFTVVNGDAPSLQATLQMLFAAQATNTGGGGGGGMQQQGIQVSASGSETSLVALRFAVDTRTNSIIVSGTTADLGVVEAILTRLDDNVRNRKNYVFRLKNSPADYVANAINQFLQNQRQVEQLTPGASSAFEQIEREVVVVPEMVTNSLILSATPRFFDEIKGIIEQLDARPPMVMIQVLIAQVDLGNTNEFGIELGLQDSVLFDRSVLSNLQTTNTTLPNGTTTSQVVSADNNPGFNFNNGNPLGNNGLGTNLLPSAVGTQGLANFGVGRQNGQLGYSGLVLSAASENVSMLIRALAENHRVEVLSRPQIMTLDNQPAFIQAGQRVPMINNVTVNPTGTTNSVTPTNVGLLVSVTPRISPDGLVVMSIDAEKSALESEATGIPIFASTGGQIIRSPITDIILTQTTISALSGQTVVLGGMIAKTKNESHRKVPLLGDIPLVGQLFRFDSTSNTRSELLIIMTPHIVRNEAEADSIRRAEAARMSWCLCDVTNLYGEAGLRRRTDNWTDAETPVVYPDNKQPGELLGPEVAPEPIPAPAEGGQNDESRRRKAAQASQASYLPPVGPNRAQSATYQQPAYPSTAQPAVYQQPAPQQQTQYPSTPYR